MWRDGRRTLLPGQFPRGLRQGPPERGHEELASTSTRNRLFPSRRGEEAGTFLFWHPTDSGSPQTRAFLVLNLWSF